MKWAVYDGGEVRPDWGVNDHAHTLAILVRGVFRLRFPEHEVVLSQEGDYVLWEPGVPHLWQAETPAVVVSVRWPSLPGDSRDVGDVGVGGVAALRWALRGVSSLKGERGEDECSS